MQVDNRAAAEPHPAPKFGRTHEFDRANHAQHAHAMSPCVIYAHYESEEPEFTLKCGAGTATPA